ncbi:MAG: tRNA uracil 4-sulfurtransferase ThiI [Anaerolineales bacterium]
MDHLYIVHYGEIGLKGKNRPDFEIQLADNIRAQHAVSRVERLRGRLTVHGTRPLDLSNVFGIAWWAGVTPVDATVEAIRREGLAIAKERIGDSPSFAVRTSRADKSFPLRSQELERLVGGDLDEALDVPVDLDDPAFTLNIEIAEGSAYLYTDRHEGPRGLPAGISGRLLGLYSAGIDSAVAAYLMGKRGASVELVHFHALTAAEHADEQKAGRLARKIAGFFPSIRVHYVPYHHFQMATLGLDRYQRQELVVFRRFMARAATKLAEQRRALALFSGDNLGQVASQTLENLVAVDQSIGRSIFRPLIAYDKQEIIDLGKRLDFDEIANESYKDCCSIIAQHPATRANLKLVRQIEEDIGVDELVDASLDESVTYEYVSTDEGVAVRSAEVIGT